MKRKIEAMHDLFGVAKDKRCEDCVNLIQGDYRGIHLRKCVAYGATHSAATDWRKKYIACGLYGHEYTGSRPIIELIKCAKKAVDDVPIDGQEVLYDES